MGINLQLPSLTETRPRITVIGVGGAGGNAVNNMIDSGLEGVEFIAANTDAQALATSSAACRIQMGIGITEGLGAGSKPEIGAAAADEALEEIRSHLEGVHMLFITAGMGGGTGTGAAPVIARAARELGVLTVGVVTMPFEFEGQRRMRLAKDGAIALAQHVDTIIIIPNQNLFRIASEKTTFADAFMRADDVLRSGVSCITDLMIKEGLINLDFADVRTVMQNMGTALMGTGEAEGEKRALQAAESAIANPLLGEISMRGAKGLLVSITGSFDMTLYEVEEAASRIRREVDPDENPDVNIIVGATFDTSLGSRIRVSVVATGIKGGHPVVDNLVGRAPPPPPNHGRDGRLAERIPGAAPAAAPAPSTQPGSLRQPSNRDQPVLRPAAEPKARKPVRNSPPEGHPRTQPDSETFFQPVAPVQTLKPPRRPLTFNDFPETFQADDGRPPRAAGAKPRGFFDWMAGRGRISEEGGKPSNGGVTREPHSPHENQRNEAVRGNQPPYRAAGPEYGDDVFSQSSHESGHDPANDEALEIPGFFKKPSN